MKKRDDPGASTRPVVPARGGIVHDTSIRAYRAKRDFTRTAEPAPSPAIGGEGTDVRGAEA